jgi:hypothetical protein
MSFGVGPYDPCPCGSGEKFKFCCDKKSGKGNSQVAPVADKIAGQIAPSPKQKMSEMISEMAAGFLWVGDTIEERQGRLTAACSAWNMACASPEVRQHQLERYGEGYLRFNPATSPTDLANILKDMASLMERKLKMFPDYKRQIVSAKVVLVEQTYRIEVASATL